MALTRDVMTVVGATVTAVVGEVRVVVTIILARVVEPDEDEIVEVAEDSGTLELLCEDVAGDVAGDIVALVEGVFKGVELKTELEGEEVNTAVVEPPDDVDEAMTVDGIVVVIGLGGCLDTELVETLLEDEIEVEMTVDPAEEVASELSEEDKGEELEGIGGEVDGEEESVEIEEELEEPTGVK